MQQIIVINCDKIKRKEIAFDKVQRQLVHNRCNKVDFREERERERGAREARGRDLIGYLGAH